MQYEEASKLNVKCQYCLKVTQALADFCTRCINICASTRVLLQAGSSRDVLKAESHVVCCLCTCVDAMCWVCLMVLMTSEH